MTDKYSDSQLKEALQSLAEEKEACHHIYGFNDTNESDGNDAYFTHDHELSKLQTITATRILDYNALLSSGTAPTETELLSQASTFHSTNGSILNLQSKIQTQSPAMTLAAEFKRASPSKGIIAPPSIKCGDQALLYAQAGASVISVLTEEHWFKGSLADLTSARLETTQWAADTTDCVRPAILRKDFCISSYMIAEAAAAGADTILLIVAITPLALLKRLVSFARDVCGMEPLVEVHASCELTVALEAGAKVIGVNNRNLHTFQMDLATTDRTADALEERNCTFHHNLGTTDGTGTAEYSICALSGMSSAQDVDRYRQKGVGMCLIGESLMRAADPKAAIQSLCLHPNDYETYMTESTTASAYTAGMKLVKVCGITNATDALTACTNGANLIGVIFAPKSKRCVSVDQAKEVVNAVRTFGERKDRASFADRVLSTDQVSPLQSLVRKARALEDVACLRPLVVGVFQNQSHDFIQQMVNDCGLDLVQLHGKEGMEAASIDKCGAPAIRVVDVETNPDGSGSAASDAVEKLLQSITTDPMAILLDTSIKGSKEGGGTGVTFDWGIAEKLQNSGLPVIIAGGLKPNNVKDAVSSIRPWGIDVSSGVEASPGKKDTSAVISFVKGAREAAVEASKGF